MYDNLENVKRFSLHLNLFHKGALKWNENAAGKPYSPVQDIVARMVPQISNMLFAVHEMICQGWLYPAEVLLRPILERLGTIAYLTLNPDKGLKLWVEGWQMGKRPSLRKRIECLPTSLPKDVSVTMDPTLLNQTKSILLEMVDSLNSATHGDEHSIAYTVSGTHNGQHFYSFGTSIGEPDYADRIALVATNMLLFFPLILDNCFGNFVVRKHK